jgi:hypothetical protein
MSGGSKAPQGYQPTGQPQADQNYQNLVAGATPWATGLPASVIPGLQGVVGATQNNPYYAQAQQGALDASAAGAQTAGFQQQGGLNLYGAGTDAYGLGGQTANSMASLGNFAQLAAQNDILRGQKVFGEGQTGYGQTQGLIPSTTGGAAYAPGLLAGAQGLAGLTAGTALEAIPGLTGGMDAASSILNTGFDPQNALYDRSYQRMLDQQNAINSMSGVATSPYGAGLTGDASRNFNIDWQNNQLQRQISALGAYGQEQGQVASNLTGLLGSAAGNYANLSGLGTNQYNAMTSGAVNNLTNLVGSGMNAANTGFQDYNTGMNTWLNAVGMDLNAMAGGANAYNQGLAAMGNAYGQGSQLGIDALQTGLASSMAPSQAYLGNQNAIQNALLALSSGGASSLAPTSSMIDAEGNYLRIGQGATSLAQNAAQINNQAAAAPWQAVGQLVGEAAAFALAPATGGMSLFGLGAKKS